MTVAIPLLTDDQDFRDTRGFGFGALNTERGNLPLLGVSVEARVLGLSAEVTIEQTFRNDFHDALEATYIFPLPDRAAVTRLQLRVAGRTIEGVLKERGEAREMYDRAIATGHRAAIAEEERSGVFTLRLGNLMPGEVGRVTLHMTQPLTFEDGEATFRFPLVVAQRYIPGTPLSGAQAGDGTAFDTDAVPDASRITPPVLLPGVPNPVRLRIGVEVDPAGLPLGGFASSLHAVNVYGELPGKTRIELRPEEGARLDRDFILRMRYRNDSVATSAVAHDSGTFRVTFMPPAHLLQTVKPRDVVFVLDRSGSMQGWKMVAARRAVARMVDTLTHIDRFTVCAFDNGMDVPGGWREDELRVATDSERFNAVTFLGGIDARGGTEMARPLQWGCDLLMRSAPTRDRVLVLITDGQVGNEDQMLASLDRYLRHLRVFTVGIDRAVNEGFLRKLATAGGGAMELVESEERLDDAMDRIHRKLGTALLSNISVSGEGVAIDSVLPSRLPALFAGSPLEVSGQYHGRMDRAAIVIKATDGEGRPFMQSLAPMVTQNDGVPRLWARQKVRELEDQYTVGSGDLKAIERTLVQVSLAHHVLCRFTAFVAIDEQEVVNQGGQVHRVTQAVEQTTLAGGSGFPLGLMKSEMARAPSAAPPPATSKGGGFAEAEAKRAQPRRMRQEDNGSADGFSQIRASREGAAPAPIAKAASASRWTTAAQGADELWVMAQHLTAQTASELCDLVVRFMSEYPVEPKLAAVLRKALDGLRVAYDPKRALAMQEALTELRAQFTAPPPASNERTPFWKR